MDAIRTEEAAKNEHPREVQRLRCAGCGGKLNRYAAASRVLCSLCLSHDTEARLICARRLQAGRRAATDPETGSIDPQYNRRLGRVRVDALHAALWRMATPDAPEDLLLVGREQALIPEEA